MNAQVDNYLVEGCMRCELGATPNCKVHKWPKELVRLREIANNCGLTETFKWSVPTYTSNGKNVLIIAAFKHFASIEFFKGALLKDDNKLLKTPGENSQAGRRLQFTSISEIENREDIIKAYILEAIEIEKSGAKIEYKKELPPFPQELLDRFGFEPEYKKAFEALTPGRQRGYLIHFSQPKSAAAKLRRIEKMKPLIFAGKGWNGR
ncbi:MAG: DUF1801 domain-containing protein [Bacteroidia bacterium]